MGKKIKKNITTIEKHSNKEDTFLEPIRKVVYSF